MQPVVVQPVVVKPVVMQPLVVQSVMMQSSVVVQSVMMQSVVVQSVVVHSVVVQPSSHSLARAHYQNLQKPYLTSQAYHITILYPTLGLEATAWHWLHASRRIQPT
jgi:hypothetical protein